MNRLKSPQRPLMVAAFIAFAMHGCTALGDGAARIKGSILDERGNAHHDCRLDLVARDGEIIDFRQPVQSAFLVTFVIAPRSDRYKLRVSCPTSDDVFISDTVSLGDLETTYKTPFNLGTVVLTRR